MKTLNNKVSLIGNLGKDPEVIEFKTGKRKANLALATSDVYKNAEGQKVESTQWHNLVVWGDGLVNIVENYLTKGREIAVEGRLNYRSYENTNGEKKYVTEVIVNELMMLRNNNK